MNEMALEVAIGNKIYVKCLFPILGFSKEMYKLSIFVYGNIILYKLFVHYSEIKQFIILNTSCVYQI